MPQITVGNWKLFPMQGIYIRQIEHKWAISIAKKKIAIAIDDQKIADHSCLDYTVSLIKVKLTKKTLIKNCQKAAVSKVLKRWKI